MENNQQQPESQQCQLLDTTKLRGRALAIATLEWIKRHPEHWDQNYWHCGTTHCFAGVAEMLGTGLDPEEEHPDRQPLWPKAYYDGEKTLDTAQELLRLSHTGAAKLFWSSNSLEELIKLVHENPTLWGVYDGEAFVPESDLSEVDIEKLVHDCEELFSNV